MSFSKKVMEKWKSYRFRFVPWIALNLGKRAEEGGRLVSSPLSDALVPPDQVARALLLFLPKLQRADPGGAARLATHNRQLMLKHLGFVVERAPSQIRDGGIGVRVTSGAAKKGDVVALYPGTIYRPNEPILLPSISNPFVFRCLDGAHIDGKDSGLSRIIFRSLSGRDKMGPTEVADCSWLGPHPVNPLNVGQYVNNNTRELPCNVAYQECELGRDFPARLLALLPYVSYSAGGGRRVVALVATRDIPQGAELLSSYYTLVAGDGPPRSDG